MTGQGLSGFAPTYGEKSTCMLVLMSAMMIHGIQPGLLLFEQHASIVCVVIAACLLSSVLMFGQMYLMIPFLRRVLDVPRQFVLPLIMVFCVVGVFASSNRMFDVWIMLGFGVLGFLMERGGLPLGPFVILAGNSQSSGCATLNASPAPVVSTAFICGACVRHHAAALETSASCAPGAMATLARPMFRSVRAAMRESNASDGAAPSDFRAAPETRG